MISSSELAVGAVYLFTFAIAYFIIKFVNSLKELPIKRPPCIPSLPFIGSLFFMPGLRTMHTFFLQKSKKLGNIIAFKVCDQYVVVLNGREAIQEALVKQSLTFADRPSMYVSRLISIDRQGIVQHPYNEDFKKLHRFSLNTLKMFGFGQCIMESRIRVEVDNLLKRFESKNDVAFDPRFEITAAVSNVICSIIFGKRWDVEDKTFLEGMEIVEDMVRGAEEPSMINFFPVLRFLPRFKRALNKVSQVHNQWHDYIRRILTDVEKNGTQECFYKIMKTEMEKEEQQGSDSAPDKSLEQSNIVQLELTIRDLFLAGTETTATTLQWFIILMANRPEVQKRVRDEIDGVVGKNRHPYLDDKQHLPVLEATLLELMRYRTLVPLAVPHSTLKDTYVNEFFIPAGTMILPNLHSAHYDPDVWDEPEKFNVDRFLDETKTKVIKKDQVISFSLGKRSCLGEILARQELFLFASSLIHEFEIYPPNQLEKLSEQEKIGVTNSPLAFEARLVKRTL